MRQYVRLFLMRRDCIGPYFVLGNPLEALVYSKLKFNTHVVESKQDKLVELLKERTTKTFSAVFCKDQSSVYMVQKMLHGQRFETVPITEEMNKFDKEQMCNYLAEARKENAVLIISDQTTLDYPLSLTPLNTIVHFDYSGSKMQFADRFLHMKKCVSSLYDEAAESMDRIKNCHLLVDAQDEKQFKTLRLLLKRCQSVVPSQLEEFFNASSQKSVQPFSKSRLCDQMKLFGQCANQWNKCKERHLFSPNVDDQGLLSITDGGRIEFSIVVTKSANQYMVVLKKIFNEEGKEVFNSLKLDLKLLKLNSRIELDPLTTELQIGEIYVVKDVDSCTKRVELLKRKEQKVTVLFIDEGRCERIEKDSLYQLPAEFKEDLIPRKACEVILMNVRPKDNQPQWPLEANELIRLALCRNEQNEQICRSKFVLGLNHTFWVRNVQVLQKADKQFSPVAELKDELKPFAQDHFNHANLLYTLCKKSKIEAKRYKCLKKFVQLWNGDTLDIGDEKNLSTVSTKKSSEKSKREDRDYPIFTTHRTAFFDQSEMSIEVKIMEIFSPAYFYVQMTKFEPQLKALEKRLKTEFEEFNNNEVGFEPINNQICIAKNDGVHYRVQYLIDDQGNEEIFLVDFGWYAAIESGLVPISKQSLEVLPFQAIRCSLADVKPNDGENWSDEAFEDFSEHLDCLFWANNFRKIENGHYQVHLLNPETSEQIASKLALKGHCQLVNLPSIDVSKFEEVPSRQSTTVIESAPPEDYQKEINVENVSCHQEDQPVTKRDDSAVKVSVDNVEIKSTRELDTKKIGLELKEIREKFNEVKSELALLSALDDLNVMNTEEDESNHMPCLVVGQDQIYAEKFPDKVTWSQSLQELTFKLQFHGFEVNASRVYIKVEPKALHFHYLHIVNNCCHLIRIPNLELFTQVKPQETAVNVKATYIEICLQKAQALIWPKPCFDESTQKGVTPPWLRRQETLVLESSSQSEGEQEQELVNTEYASSVFEANEIDNDDVVDEADCEDSSDTN